MQTVGKALVEVEAKALVDTSFEQLKTYSPKLTPRRTSTEFQKDYRSGRLDNWQHTARGQYEGAKGQGG